MYYFQRKSFSKMNGSQDSLENNQSKPVGNNSNVLCYLFSLNTVIIDSKHLLVEVFFFYLKLVEVKLN